MAKKVAAIKTSIIVDIQGTEAIQKKIESLDLTFKKIKDNGKIKYDIDIDNAQVKEVLRLRDLLTNDEMNMIDISINSKSLQKFLGQLTQAKDFSKEQVEDIGKILIDAIKGIGDVDINNLIKKLSEASSTIKTLKKDAKDIDSSSDKSVESLLKKSVKSYYKDPNKFDIKQQKDLLNQLHAYEEIEGILEDDLTELDKNKFSLTVQIKDGEKVKIDLQSLINLTEKLQDKWSEETYDSWIDESDDEIDKLIESNERYLDSLSNLKAEKKSLESALADKTVELVDEQTISEEEQQLKGLENQLKRIQGLYNSIFNEDSDISQKQRRENIKKIPKEKAELFRRLTDMGYDLPDNYVSDFENALEEGISDDFLNNILNQKKEAKVDVVVETDTEKLQNDINSIEIEPQPVELEANAQELKEDIQEEIHNLPPIEVEIEPKITEVEPVNQVSGTELSRTHMNENSSVKIDDQPQDPKLVELTPDMAGLNEEIQKRKSELSPIDIEIQPKSDWENNFDLTSLTTKVTNVVNEVSDSVVTSVNKIKDVTGSIDVKTSTSLIPNKQDFKKSVSEITLSSKLKVDLKPNIKSLNDALKAAKINKVKVEFNPITKTLNDRLNKIKIQPINVELKPKINDLKKALSDRNDIYVSVNVKRSSVKDIQAAINSQQDDITASISLTPNIKQLQKNLNAKDNALTVNVNLIPNIKKLKKDLKKVKDFDIEVKDKTKKPKANKQSVDKQQNNKNDNINSEKSYTVSQKEKYSLDKRMAGIFKSLNVDNLLDKKIDLFDESIIGDAKEFKNQIEAIQYRAIELSESLNNAFSSASERDKAVVDLKKILDLLSNINNESNQLNHGKVKTIGTFKDSTAGKSEAGLQHIIEKQLQDQYDSIDFSNFNAEAKSFDVEFVKDDILHKATIQLKDYTNAAGEAAMTIQMFGETTKDLQKKVRDSAKEWEVSLLKQSSYDAKIEKIEKNLDTSNLLDRKIDLISDDEISDAMSFEEQVSSLISKVKELRERMKKPFDSKEEKDEAVVNLNKRIDLLNQINSMQNQLNTKKKENIFHGIVDSNDNTEDIQELVYNQLKNKYENVKLGKYNSDTKSMKATVIDANNMMKQGAVVLSEYTNANKMAATSIDLVIKKEGEYTSSGRGWVNGIKNKLHNLTQYITGIEMVMRVVNEIRKGFTFVQELDSKLTTINQTMDVTRSELKDLSNGAIEMGQSLKTSAQNVLDAVAIYANATETTESILEKAKPTIMLANASGADISTVSDQIQGV